MADNIKLNPQHGSMEQRITNRLRNSGEGAGNPGHTVVTKGTGPTRTHTNLHQAAGHHGGGAEGGNVRLQDQGRQAMSDNAQQSELRGWLRL